MNVIRSDRMRWWTLQFIKAKNPKVRMKAVHRLAMKPDAAYIGVLELCLSDEVAEIRVAAVKALGAMPRPGSLNALVKALGKSHEDVRAAAIDELARISGPSAVGLIENSIKDAAHLVRNRAALALGAIGWLPGSPALEAWRWVSLGEYQKAASLGAAAVEALAAALKDSPYYHRQTVVEALGQVGDARAVKLLRTALQDDDFNVRIRVIETLAEARETEAGPGFIRALADPVARVRAQAAEALGILCNAEAVDPLIKLLDDLEWEVRLAAIVALGKMSNPKAARGIAAALKDPDAEIREAAVKAIGAAADPAAIEFLVPALIDIKTTVRHKAASALAAIDKEWEKNEIAHRAVPTLKAALKHKDYQIRQAATDVLSKMGIGRFGEPALGGMINASRLQRETVLECLESMLRDEDADIRQAAAENLGRLGDRRCFSVLEPALGDADLWVRCATAAALKQLNWKTDSTEVRMKWIAALKVAEELPMPPLRMAR